jgi:intracellular septation protein A
VGEQFSFEKAFGGLRGVLESVLPVTVFSVVYGITRDVKASAAAALVPSAVLAVWRLVAREPLTQAVGGLLGVGLGAFIAVRTGHAQTFFLPSIIKNSAYGAAYLASILARWPLVGVILGIALGEGRHWRDVPARYRAYLAATWLWVGLFAVRLAVQVPLYLADRPALLGAVNVGLGLPLFGLVIWGSWLLLRRVPVARPAPEPAVSDT